MAIFQWCHSQRPLYGGCPLVGGSVIAGNVTPCYYWNNVVIVESGSLYVYVVFPHMHVPTALTVISVTFHQASCLFSFEAQLQQWLSQSSIVSSGPLTKRQQTKRRHSLELKRSEQEGWDELHDSGASIRRGLQQLHEKIRQAKRLDTRENILLHSLISSPRLTSSQSWLVYMYVNFLLE